MRINLEQFNTIVANLDSVNSRLARIERLWNESFPVIDKNTKDLLTRLERIEQAQGVLCERLDAISGCQESLKQEQIFHNRHTSEDWASLRTAIDALYEKLQAKHARKGIKRKIAHRCA